MPLVHPTYFAPIAQYAALYDQKNIIFEVCDNFQKQTYRNRCYIAGPNGKQLLNIPIVRQKNTPKVLTKDIEIDYTAPWHTIHLKSMNAAYSGSPFFEFYTDDIQKILLKKHRFLLDLNLEAHHFIMDALQLENIFSKTTHYEQLAKVPDYRILANAKRESNTIYPAYNQLFDKKHGFIQNLSILDLLFMEGTAAYNYLIKVKKTLPNI